MSDPGDMSESLNVIALISGGKDSLYSLLHCVHHGHQLVALANLYPSLKKFPEQNVSSSQATEDVATDINSFMYQTVGHSIIPLYSEALGIPLYRREISGRAAINDRDYGYAAQDDIASDETEDLTLLLREIMLTNPSANAISTGAIQSTYQRTRVESVASRLGLIPLSFLWQYPLLPAPSTRSNSLTGLLDDMEYAGCDARIIKIASGGISERLLWANVANNGTKQALLRGLSPFFEKDEFGLKGAVVGEGGEYETMALHGPRSIWKHGRIEVVIDKTQTWSGEGGTSYIKLGTANLVTYPDREETSVEKDQNSLSVPIPALLDDEFAAIDDRMGATPQLDRQPSPNIVDPTTSSYLQSAVYPMPTMHYIADKNSVQINNLTCKTLSSNFDKSEPALSSKDQMQGIVSRIPKLLTELSSCLSLKQPLTTASIVHTTIVLRSIDTFTLMNPIYALLFVQGVPNPPARVTIAAQLPPGIDVSLSIMIDLGPRERRSGLHVQSRSYWAPANIGPYSQAIAVSVFGETVQSDQIEAADATAADFELVHVAGQIPLNPASMELIDGPFHRNVILSLQHLWRLGQEREVDIWGFGIAFLARKQTNSHPLHSTLTPCPFNNAKIAARIWKQRHCSNLAKGESEDEVTDEPDIWHIRHNRFMHTQTFDKDVRHGQNLRALPYNNGHPQIVPPFVAALVSALPRHAEIEWWSTGFSKLCSGHHVHTRPPVVLQMQSTPHHMFSVSTFNSPSSASDDSAVLIVAYMIKSISDNESRSTHGTIYTTVKELIDHALQGFGNANLSLASSIGYVAHRASGLYDKLFSSDSTERQRGTDLQTFPCVPVTTEDRLGDISSIINVDALWGHCGKSLDSADVGAVDGPDEELVELDAAFLLRFTLT